MALSSTPPRRIIPAHLKVDPVFDCMRSDFRFHDLMRRMNFPT
jgi:hypothetical protein